MYRVEVLKFDTQSGKELVDYKLLDHTQTYTHVVDYTYHNYYKFVRCCIGRGTVFKLTFTFQ